MEEIKNLHDKIKQSPYWLGFDEDFVRELRRDYYKLTDLISAKFEYHSINVYSDKYYALLQPMHHDVRSYVGCLEYRKGQDGFGDVILYLQQYLTLVHQMIDGWETPHICVKTKYWTQTMYSEQFDHPNYGKVWRNYVEIPKEQKQIVIDWWREHFGSKESIKKFIEEMENDTCITYRFI